MKPIILVRGSNDIGSAVAHALFQAGYLVVIHEIQTPTVTRRKMAFTDAIFDGFSTLEGVEAQRVVNLPLSRELLLPHDFIPLSTSKLTSLLETIQPHILIDAQMKKHQSPEAQLGLAPLTIGLGPNFVAGTTTNFAIETKWGDSLGQIISHGSTKNLKGEPKPIGGHARDRYVYAPVSGIFYTQFQPGDPVEQWQEIAFIEKFSLQAPLDGVLRGITHTNIPVKAKTKIIEVDPRGKDAQVAGIPERPSRIAQGVLKAVQKWETKRYVN